MRSKKLCKLLFLLLPLGIIAGGCSQDDEYPGPAPKTVNAAYFSGGSASGNQLNLLYSGSEWDGKEARFNTSDGEKATVTLKNVIPGENLSFFEVALVPSADSYAFNGTTTTSTGTTLQYEGVVRASLLTLNLKVAQPASPMAGTWNLVPLDIDESTGEMRSLPLRLTWEADGEWAVPAAKLGAFLSSLGSLYIRQYLETVTFGADGNISARYHNNLPDTEWTDSPLNLCLFYPKNDLLYVSPDVRMITALVQQNKALRTAALKTPSAKANTRAMSVIEIIGLLSQVLQWGQEGIPFHVRDNVDGTVSVFIDQATLAPIIPLLPSLIDYLPVDETMAETIGDLVEHMAVLLPQTTRLELGIDLSK